MAEVWRPFGWYAAAFPATYVLLSFTATPNPASALWRPLLAAIAIGVVLQLALTLLLPRPARAALIASAILCVGLATWIPVLVAVAGGVWLLLIGRRQQDGGRRWTEERVSRAVQAFAWLLLVVAAVPAITSLVSGLPASPTPAGTAPSGTQDIVVVLVDGYPRADVLEQRFGIDNGPFLAALSDRGFDVASSSRANYTSTWMTLASMVNGRFVEEIPSLGEAPDDPAEQYRRLMRAIAGGALLDEARSRGYEVVAIPSSYDSAALNGADRMLVPPQLNSFELSLIQHSLAGRGLLELAPDIAFTQHRERVVASLALAAEELAVDRERPRLLFVHVLAPHAPIAFGDASHAPSPECFPACSMYLLGPNADWDRYGSHLEAVNALLLDAVDRLLEGSPEATIVLMSDHGTVGPAGNEMDAFASFFAARTTSGADGFPEDVSPVDAFRRLLDPSASPTPYRAWLSEAQRPMSVVPVSEAASE